MKNTGGGVVTNVAEKKMEKLIPTINKLQDAFTIAGLPSLELPQIAGTNIT